MNTPESFLRHGAVSWGKLLWWLLLLSELSFFIVPPRLHAALPVGFSETLIAGPAGGWNEAVGVMFETNGRIYVWERGGRVWFKDPTDTTFTLLLDISEEVMPYLDHGMLGLALDPAFRENGRIYVSYAVDRHHLLYYGTPDYNPNTTLVQVATIGRVTRYTCRSTDGYRSVDPASRFILIGETKGTGIPVLSDTHFGGCLVFGTDGTLLVSSGDGTSPYGADIGGTATSNYSVQGLNDGIIRPAEDVGAYRSQLLNSYSGKILRIDPVTGNGLPSNPFYDATYPRSPQSRAFALGLRNPFRMVLRPGTGSHNPADGDPGVLYIGDVGWNAWEELNVLTGPRQNFGWPLFEGNFYAVLGSYTYNVAVANRDTPNPLYPGAGSQYLNFGDLLKQDTTAASGQPPFPNPTNPSILLPSSIPQFLQRRPVLDWNHDNDITRVPTYDGAGQAQTVNVGSASSPVSGNPFHGNCSVGGVWYTGTAFPATYQNTFFHADWGQGLIKNIVFDGNNRPTALRDFLTGGGFVTCIAQHPIDGSLYYVNFDYSASTVRRIAYTGNRPPSAIAAADRLFGPEPLAIQFSSVGSTDPDGDPIVVSWNFGDGSPASTAANPIHTFPASGGQPASYSVTLTVTDNGGLSSQALLKVAVNDTPPTVTILSPLDGSYYNPLVATTVNLNALVLDSESADSQLLYQWQTILHHNDHGHASPADTQHATSTVLSPTGPDDGVDVYYYEILLAVTDPQGLTTTRSARLYPDYGGNNTPPTIGAIANQTTAVNTPVGPLAFTIGDAETAAGSLTVSGTSSNQTLVPNASITFGGSGSNRTVTVTPATNQTGTATITVSVSDGALSAASTFTLTVNPATSSGLVAAYNFNEGTGTSLTDLSGNANSGAITGATWTTAGKYGGALAFNGSSNLVVVNSSPSLNFSTAMTIEAWVYPTASQSGWRTIVQREVDAYFLHAGSNSPLQPAGGGTFGGTVSFAASSSAIPINAWTHLAVTYDQTTIRLYANGLQVASQARTGTIQSTSSPLRIGSNVPYGEFFLGLIDDVRLYNRALSVAEIQTDMNTPVATSSAPPTISAVANQTMSANTTIGPIPFTVGDADTPLANLILSGSSSNTTLVPNANITFGGAGANRTTTITPTSGLSGVATITLTVSDGFSNATSPFTLTVNPASPTNTPPTITAIANQTTPANTPVGPLAFTIGDAETAAGNLTLSGTSSNQTLVPNASITFGGSGSNRTVTVTPATNQTGTATITVSVSDGALSAASTFTLTVNPAAGSGLVAAYNFNQGAGTTLTDVSGNANTGAITGATWTTAGKYGGALTFNGSSNLVVVNSSPSLNLSTAMTIEAWVYPTASQTKWRTIVQKEADAYFLHASSNTTLRPAGGGTFNGSVSFVASTTAIPTNTWTHLAVTYDGANVRLFVNGIQVASKAKTGAIQTTSAPLRIGGNVPYGEFFLGRIDEVRLYSRALGVTEIQADMNTPLP